ncbi:MAG TPA: hypothetical protein VKV21_13520 [Solirubrobacteraceae bacterium]|nr:hypothetical protein [Solirubrobacteraceae bacterium]
MHCAAWLLLVISISTYATISIAVDEQPFYVGARRLRFFDLRVYRAAAGALLGRPVGSRQCS